MTTPTLHEFGPLTPVVPGITLLEASAGTGKTYQITNLVLRLLVDNDVPLPRVLIVTYTKAATAELKERVRQRLVAAQRAVELAVAPAGDLLLGRYVAEAQADPDRSLQIRARLRRARESFDQALISTIHGFCQRMLQLHAFETGTAFGRSLETDATDVLQTIVDDWLVRRLHDTDETRARLLRDGCGLKRAPMLALVRQAVSDPDMPVLPRSGTTTVDAWIERVRDLGRGLDDDNHPAMTLTRLISTKSGDFDGRTYGKRYAAARLAWLKGLISDPVRTPSAGDASGRWFTTTQLTAKAKTAAGRALAADPFFAEVEALVAQAADLATAERLDLVRHARQALAAHHRTQNTQSFQDLLRDLDRVLADPVRGPRLCHAIRQRFVAALIDEFQDTDAQQWRIFGKVFGGLGAPTSQHYLYLIGDPKQAIYGFRGANVHVYLAARDQAPPDRRFTMRRNYRSDGRLIAAMNHLMHRPGVFGSAGIDYIRVSAHHTGDRIAPGPGASPAEHAPLQLVWVDSRATGGDSWELLGNTLLQDVLAQTCAADVVELLASGTTIEGRLVRPGDCAVLVRNHVQAAAVHSALDQRGVPAIIASKGQVFEALEARSLQRFLHALGNPSDEAAARVLAADPLLAWSAAELPGAAGDDDDTTARWWEQWLTTLARWRTRFQHDGFMATFRALLDHIPPWADDRLSVAPRVLAAPGGERRMTDLLHLAELLHAEHTQSSGGLAGLHTWLQRQRDDGHPDADAAELRLETDANAVQVVTVHKSKGLQYGVVFAPYLWKDEGGRNAPPVVARDPDDPTRRNLVVSTADPLAKSATDRADTDSREEAMRLVYVALTRARHRCVVYCPGLAGKQTRRVHGPLAALFHGGPPEDAHATTDRIVSAVDRFTQGSIEPPELQWAELSELARTSVDDQLPTISLRAAGRPSRARWTPPKPPRTHLVARRFPRPIDDGWRRHSYSALTRADLAARSEEAIDPARGLGFDDDGSRAPASRSPGLPHPAPHPGAEHLPEVPLAPFPAGADAGTCLHAIFEDLDFRVVHPDSLDSAALSRVASHQLQTHGFSDPAHLALVEQCFPDVLATPLGPLLPHLRLCDIPWEDRLDELRFDFPVAGGEDFGRGEASHTRVTAEALRDALACRTDDDTVPMAWIDQVAELDFRPLVGMMTGSIDLVFRTRDHSDSIGRWFVVDYKSNRLDPNGIGRAVLPHFHFAGMRYEMAHHHYFLQYHLYTLALHRFLRARLGAAYDYDTHFGGVAYLFVRGMTGGHATDPTRPGGRPGVFTDRPPRVVIDALDRVFEGQGGGT